MVDLYYAIVNTELSTIRAKKKCKSVMLIKIMCVVNIITMMQKLLIKYLTTKPKLFFDLKTGRVEVRTITNVL